MVEHTLVVRLPDDDDPTVAQAWQRCLAAAETFGGELVGWETGHALLRIRLLQESLEQLRTQLAEHGWTPPDPGPTPATAPPELPLQSTEVHPAAGARPDASGSRAAGGIRVAGEVVQLAAGALEWQPRSAGALDEAEAERRLLGMLALAGPGSSERLPLGPVGAGQFQQLERTGTALEPPASGTPPLLELVALVEELAGTLAGPEEDAGRLPDLVGRLATLRRRLDDEQRGGPDRGLADRADGEAR